MIGSKYFACIAAVVLLAGCQKAANTSSNISSSPANAVVGNANANPAATNAAANDPGDFNGSPTEVYKAAYTARKNCDLSGLKKVMSKKLLDYLTGMGKSENKSLDDTLKDICANPQASTEQVRNEKIDGDRASIEYLDENNEWQPMDFVKEGGVWKMGLSAHGEDEPDNPVNNKDDNRS